MSQWAAQVRACMAAPEKIVINANGRSVCPPSDPVAVAPTEPPPRFHLAPGSVVVPTSPVPAVRSTPQVPALDVPTLYQTAREAVVLVETKYGTGSGFIIRSDGLIITNAHVVAGFVAGEKEAITVQIEGEKTPVFAELIGFDYQGADLAPLRVPRNRRPLLLAKTIQIGEPAFAIGSPFAASLGLINLITDGIVSGVTEEQVVTNVLTNKGNSGGPLLNSRGEVIGVTTLNFRGDGSAVGIKFEVNVKRVDKFLRAALTGSFATVAQQIGRTEVLKEINRTIPIPSLPEVLKDSSI